MELENDAGDQLEWRDTYFILFQESGRPTLTQVEAALSAGEPVAERVLARMRGIAAAVAVARDGLGD